MPQYFDNVNLPHEDLHVLFTIEGKDYDLNSDKGVFSKRSLDFGTELLIKEALKLQIKGKVLDLGTGLGPIGLILATSDPTINVLCSDVNLRALELCALNAQKYGVSERLKTVHSDVFSNIKENDFDLIISNPPIRAGKKVTYRIYEESIHHLKDGGALLIVIRKQQGAESVYKYLQTIYKDTRVIASKKGYKIILSRK